MVSEDLKKRSSKEFSLGRIHELAGNGKINYGNSDVQRDIENLGYSPEQVGECLGLLRTEHYRESIHYGDRKGWLDIYCISFSAGKHVDDLYIKLKLNRDCIMIVLSSFHREGAL